MISTSTTFLRDKPSAATAEGTSTKTSASKLSQQGKLAYEEEKVTLPRP